MLGAEQQANIESTLAQIFELACDEGWQAILEAANYTGDKRLPVALTPDACPYERAMRPGCIAPSYSSKRSSRDELTG
jgi:hypothetical protein